jgi:hypothetical protein
MPRPTLALPLLALSLLACRNSQGWTRDRVAKATEECVAYHRDRPDVAGIVKQARDAGRELGAAEVARFRDEPFDQAMIQSGCACAFRAVSERVRLADFERDEGLRRREFGRARDACVGRSPAPMKLEARAPANDPRVACPAGSAQRSQAVADETVIWCEDEAGYRHGPERSYYTGGQVADEQEWAHGLRTGVVRKYHQDGRLAHEAHYRVGVLEGRSARWYENGKLQREAEWRADEAVGVQRSWAYDGRLEATVDPEKPDPASREEFEAADVGAELSFEAKNVAFSLGADGRLRDRGSEARPVALPVGTAAITRAWYTGSAAAPVRSDPLLVLALRARDGRTTGLAVRIHVLWREDGEEVNHAAVDGVRWSRALPFAPSAAVAWGRFLYVGGPGAAAKIDLLDGKLAWASTKLGSHPLAAARYEDGRVAFAAEGAPALEVVLDDRTGEAPGAKPSAPLPAKKGAPARKGR